MRRTKMAAGWKVAVVGLGSGALLTGCATSVASSSSGTQASTAGTVPAPSSTASGGAPCRQITSLRTSLARLTQITGHTVPARQIASSASHAQQELTGLAGQAGAFSAQAGQLRGELSRLGKDAQAVARHPSSSNAGALNSAVTTLKNHVAPLISEMQAVCPGS